MLCYPVKAWNLAELTEQSRFPPPCVDFCLIGWIWFPARMSRLWVSHHATYCERLSLTSYWPVVHTCLPARHAVLDRARAAAGPSTFWLLASQWVPLRSWLILLASHCMALARVRKKPSYIAQEIEIFSIFAGWVPKLAPKHNLRFPMHTLLMLTIY